MREKLVKISYGGRVTIPKEARIQSRVDEGEQALLSWFTRNNKLILEITPVEIEIRPRGT